MIHEYSSPERKGDSLDHLAHTMQVNGINLDAEVTGAIARKLFEVGLEVCMYVCMYLFVCLYACIYSCVCVAFMRTYVPPTPTNN
jgi:hypothetical protein